MITRKKVQSSNLNFQKTEVNIDTAYERFNEEKWIEEDKHIGWIYDEKQYTIQEYLEKVAKHKTKLEEENIDLSSAVMELTEILYEKNLENEDAIMELTNLLGGME